MFDVFVVDELAGRSHGRSHHRDVSCNWTITACQLCLFFSFFFFIFYFFCAWLNWTTSAKLSDHIILVLKFNLNTDLCYSYVKPMCLYCDPVYSLCPTPWNYLLFLSNWLEFLYAYMLSAVEQWCSPWGSVFCCHGLACVLKHICLFLPRLGLAVMPWSWTLWYCDTRYITCTCVQLTFLGEISCCVCVGTRLDLVSKFAFYRISAFCLASTLLPWPLPVPRTNCLDASALLLNRCCVRVCGTGTFVSRVVEYREEMTEFSSSLRQNVKDVGKKIKEFFVESGLYDELHVIMLKLFKWV